MSYFSRFLKRLNPDEQKLNNLVNASIAGSFYNLLARFIEFIVKKAGINSDIIKNLDNIYFVLLTILIFIIPFAKTGFLGFFAGLLIIISIVNSFFTHKKFHFSSIHVPVCIYLALLLVSVGFSSLFWPSLKGFAKMLIYIGAFFSFFEFLKKNPHKIFKIIIAVALSCCIELLFALKQMLFGVDALALWQDMTNINSEHIMNRVFGTLKPFNPNLFAAYLLACAPCVFVSAFYCFLKSKKRLGFAFLGFAFLTLFTIVQTGCRGAYIGMFLGSVLFGFLSFFMFKDYFAQYKNLKKVLTVSILCVVIAVIVAVLVSPAISHRLESIFTLRGDSSNSYRMNVYISSFKIFLDNFWIGIGPGNTTYRLIYGLYMVTGFDALGAYNIYLEMAVESGFLAPIIFLWMIVLAFGKSLKNLFNYSLKYKLVVIACLSAIFAMLMHGFFDTIWYRPQLQLIFWLYMAILAVFTMKEFADGQK